MEPLILTYTGNDYQAAIAEARRRNPEHIGTVIAIPRGRLEWLLRKEKALSASEAENG